MKTHTKTFCVIIGAIIGLTLSLHAFAKESGKAVIRGKATVTKGIVVLYYGEQGKNLRERYDFNDGNFVVGTELEKPDFYLIYTSDPTLKKFNLYLQPEDDISIAVKNNKIILSGKGSALNQFYLDMSLQYGFKDSNHSDKEAYTGRIKAINTSTLAEVKEHRKILLAQTQAEYLTAAFGDYIQAKISPPSTPLAKTQFADWDLKFVPELTTCYNWIGLLNEFMYAKIDAGELKIHNANNWVADFASSISDQTLREAYIVELIHLMLKEKELVTIHDLAKQSLPLVKDKANVAKINAMLQDANKETIFKNSLPGTDFSTLTFHKPDGTKTTISDYKGKVVFIDIWATWCAPCIAEMPFLKRVEHGMEEEDIVFLSVCGNTKEVDWLNYLKKNNSTGEQLWLPEGTNSPFFRQIAGSGIPRFVILDKAGKMLNPKCYLRPSNPVLSVYLKDLVNKSI